MLHLRKRARQKGGLKVRAERVQSSEGSWHDEQNENDGTRPGAMRSVRTRRCAPIGEVANVRAARARRVRAQEGVQKLSDRTRSLV